MSQATGPKYTVAIRRRRLGVTDYEKRLALLKNGTPRLVVRRTSRMIIAQVVSYTDSGDRVLTSASSKELGDFAFPANANTPSAYLVGMLAGKRAVLLGVKNAIADLGRQTPSKGSVLFAAIKGAVDGGLSIPVSPDVLPSAERLSGKEGKTDRTSGVASAKSQILALTNTSAKNQRKEKKEAPTK